MLQNLTRCVPRTWEILPCFCISMYCKDLLALIYSVVMHTSTSRPRETTTYRTHLPPVKNIRQPPNPRSPVSEDSTRPHGHSFRYKGPAQTLIYSAGCLLSRHLTTPLHPRCLQYTIFPSLRCRFDFAECGAYKNWNNSDNFLMHMLLLSGLTCERMN